MAIIEETGHAPLTSMRIYDNFKWPDGIPDKPWDELTPEQQQTIKDAYRFSGFKPGQYQGITGIM